MNPDNIEIKQRWGEETAKRLTGDEKITLSGIIIKLRAIRQSATQLRQAPIVDNIGPGGQIIVEKPYKKNFGPQQAQSASLKNSVIETLRSVKEMGYKLTAAQRRTTSVTTAIMSEEAKLIINNIGESDVTEETAPYVTHLIDECLKQEFSSPQRKIKLAEEVKDLLKINTYFGERIIKNLLAKIERTSLSVVYRNRLIVLETEITNVKGQYETNNLSQPVRNELNNFRQTATDLRNTVLVNGEKNYTPQQLQQAQNLANFVQELIERTNRLPDSFLSPESKSLIAEINIDYVTAQTAPYVFHLFDELARVPPAGQFLLINNREGLINLAEETTVLNRSILELKNPLLGHQIIKDLTERVDGLPNPALTHQQILRLQALKDNVRESRDKLFDVKNKQLEKHSQKGARLSQERNRLLGRYQPSILPPTDQATSKKLMSDFFGGETFTNIDKAELERLWRLGGLHPTEITALWQNRDAYMGYLQERAAMGEGKMYEEMFFSGEQSDNIKKYVEVDPQVIKNLLEAGREDEYRLKITEIFSSVYSKLDDRPSERSDHIFNSFYLTPIEDRLHQLMTTTALALRESGYKEYAEVVKGVSAEQKRIKGLWVAFHDAMIYAHMGAGFDEWIKLIYDRKASEFATLYTQPREGKMFMVACSMVERYLQGDFALNKNQPRPELFGGEYDEKGFYHSPDDDKMKEMIKSALRGDKECTDPKSWEINRALSLAKGYHLTATLRMLELFATADPRKGMDFRGNFLAGVLGQIYLKWSWAFGRATEYPNLPRYFSILRRLPISRKGKGLRQMLKDRGGWSPAKLMKLVASEKVDELGKELMLQLVGGEAFFEDILHHVCFIGRESRNGWRTKPALKVFFTSKQWKDKIDAMGIPQNAKDVILSFFDKDKFGAWKDQKEWDKFYENILRPVVGASAEFWYSEDRAAGVDFKNLTRTRFIRDQRFRKNITQFLEDNSLDSSEALNKLRDIEIRRNLDFPNLNDQDWEKKKIELFNFSDSQWKAMEDEDIEFVITDPHNRKRIKISRFDFIGMQRAKYDGQAWSHLFMRSPIDFLLPLCQLVPELLLSDKKWAEMAKGRRNDLLVKFGTDSWNSLDKIRRFYHEVGPIYSVDFGANGMNKESLMRLTSDLSRAFFQLQQGGDIRQKAKLDLNLITNPDLKRAVSNLRFEFLNQVDQVDAFTQNEDIGEDRLVDLSGNFFVRAAKEFVKKGYFFPTSADMDQSVIDKNLASVGEEMITRLYTDLGGLRQITAAVSGLEETIYQASVSGDLDPLHSILRRVMDYQNFVGPTEARSINFDLISVAGRFFHEDWATRIPFIGPLIKLALGSNASISKLVRKDKRMYSMNNDAFRGFVEKADLNGEIAKKGRYGKEEIYRSVGAGLKKFLATEAIPGIFGMLVIFLLWMYIKKASGEAGEKKQ